ncbi:MAG: MBL fold metallo-hydrolase [Ilumatobacteraceae bacterium]
MCQAADVLRRAEPPAPAALPAWREVLARRRAPRHSDATNRVITLGTGGGSNPKATRAGFANAVVVGDTAYLVDAGEGAHTQLWRAGLTLNASFRRQFDRPLVRGIFVTHLHADHIVDLANLFVGSWPPHVVDLIGPGPAGLPIPVFPPDADRALPMAGDPTPGLRAFIDHQLAAFAYNINLRVLDEGRPPLAEAVRVREINVAGPNGPNGAGDITLDMAASAASPAAAAPAMEPVEVFRDDERGVVVSAALVQHAPVFPAFGYRFDTPTGSVAFSGDTGECDNVVRLARGADVLVHEVIDLASLESRISHLSNFEAVRNHLAMSHSSPEQVGRIATAAGVRTLVLSHLVPGDVEHTEDEWEAAVRPHFDGEIVCAVDLDAFGLG